MSQFRRALAYYVQRVVLSKLVCGTCEFTQVVIGFEQGRTALMHFARLRDVDSVRLLLDGISDEPLPVPPEHCVSPAPSDSDGFTALHHCCDTLHEIDGNVEALHSTWLDTMHVLLFRGAPLHQPTKVRCWQIHARGVGTLFSYLCVVSQKGKTAADVAAWSLQKLEQDKVRV